MKTVLITLGTFSGVLLPVIFYLLKNPEIIDKWSNIFYRFAFWMGEIREKRIVSSDLDYRITCIAKKINNEASGIIPYGIRIKWKDPIETIPYLQGGNVIIVLRKSDNLDENIVKACCAYVPHALLPKARNIIDDKILRSLDTFMTKNILAYGQYSSSYHYFVTNVLQPALEEDVGCQQMLDDIDKMNEIGMLTRILLEEYRKLGDMLYGTMEEMAYKNETKEFFEFLRRFAKRKPGDYSKLNFLGKKIKIAIILIAKKRTLRDYGIENHLKCMDMNRKNGVMRAFVFSYSQIEEESILNQEGYVIDVKRKATFSALNQFEEACNSCSYLKLTGKQNYKTKDAGGNWRSAKYLVYEVLP